MIFAHSDYRAYLKQILSERIQKNPSYSLRAFSKQLGISPAQLSKVFSGQKHLSYESAMSAGQSLGLESEEFEYFFLLIQYASTNDASLRSEVAKKMSRINQNRSIQNLDLEAFQMISDWYHIPILEMTALPKTQFTPKKIARRLGISLDEAEIAVNRLLRLKLIEKMADGSHRKTYADGLFNTVYAHLGLRDYHAKMLEKATLSLSEQPNSSRFVGSETFAFDPELFELFCAQAEKFFSRSVTLAKRSSKPKEVYYLGVQFFRLTSEEK
jgi:uncharacterized protein (TIGR02147 family)